MDGNGKQDIRNGKVSEALCPLPPLSLAPVDHIPAERTLESEKC